MAKTFDELFASVRQCPKKVLSVACADDLAVLQAVQKVMQLQIIDPILVGDEPKIRQIAGQIGMDEDQVRIIHEPDRVKAAHLAVSLVSSHQADIYMKGLLPTKDFLRSILDKEVGLRSHEPLSHCAVFEVPGIDHLLFLSDVAFIPYPTLEEKKVMIRYCVQLAHSCGIKTPHVAPLAAVEVVNPKMPVTVEAQQLHEAYLAGEFPDCVVDGPLSLDIALYPSAALEKGAQDRPCAGKADILIFPDIHAGNITYKAMTHMIPYVRAGGLLTGTTSPVILTSRSDSMDVKVNSIFLAALLSEHQKSTRM